MDWNISSWYIDNRIYWIFSLSISIHQRLYLIVAEHFKRPLEYNPDGPIMTCMREPQLMFVRGVRSTFMTKRKMNDEINKDWKKNIASMPICCGRYIK